MFKDRVKETSKGFLKYCSRIDNRYSILAKIGDGRHGRVFLAFDQKTDMLVALKVLSSSDSYILLCNFLKEITALVRVNTCTKDTRVARIIGFNFKGSDEFGNTIVYYTMEYVELGELFEVLKSTTISEKLACYFILQIVKTVEKLHLEGVYHLDLKPENVLLSEHGELCLCDFGNSVFLKNSKKNQNNKNDQKFAFKKQFPLNRIVEVAGKMRFLGTSEYSAPELHLWANAHSLEIESRTHIFKDLDPRKVDSFSLGVFMFVMIVNSLPFGKADPKDPYYRRFLENKTTFWDVFERYRRIDSSFKEAFEALVTDVSARKCPTVERLSEFDWFCKNGKTSSLLSGQKKDLELDDITQRELVNLLELRRTQILEKIKIDLEYSKNGYEILNLRSNQDLEKTKESISLFIQKQNHVIERIQNSLKTEQIYNSNSGESMSPEEVKYLNSNESSSLEETSFV